MLKKIKHVLNNLDLCAVNRTGVCFLISEILDRLADATPENLAYDDGSTTITYSQLEALTNKIARALEPTIEGNFEYVFLKISNRLEFLFSWALCKLGVSHGSYNQTLENLPLGQVLIITDDDKLQSLAHTVMLASQKFLFELASLPDTNYRRQLSENPQRIAFTSGSTGDAKAIGFSLDKLVDRAKLGAEHWDKTSPRFFLLGQASIPGQYLKIISVFEQSVYLAPNFPKTNVELIKKHAVRSVMASPSQLSELVNARKQLGVSIESLKVVQVAGGKITNELVTEFSDVEVINYYASSEAGPVASKRSFSGDGDSVGKIFDSVELEIVDENHQPLSQGQVGQIRVRRNLMSTAYLGEVSSDAFRDGFFYPGDLGYIDNDGELHLQGRVSETLNIGGVKIDINKIEALLLETKNFKELAVFVYQDIYDMPKLGLAIVLKESSDKISLVEEIRKLLGEKQPTLIIELESIPKTPSGKIARAELSKKAKSTPEIPS